MILRLRCFVFLLIAFCLAIGGPSAFGYNDWGDNPINESHLPYNINNLSSASVYAPLVENMAARWNIYCDVFRIYVDRRTPGFNNGVNDQVGFLSDQGYADYFWFQGGWPADAIGVTFPEYNILGPTEHNDIAYKSGETWATSYDEDGKLFQGTAIHELGHGIGLDHNFNDMSVMNYGHPKVIDDHLMPDDLRYLYDRFPNRAKSVNDMGVWAYRSNGTKSFAAATVSPITPWQGDTIEIDGIYVGNLKNGTQSGAEVRFYISQDETITPSDLYIGKLTFAGDWPKATGGRYDNLVFLVPWNTPTGVNYVGMIVYYNGTSTDSVTYNNSARISWILVNGCSYGIDPLQKGFPEQGGTGSISVTANSSRCGWTAVANASWISITSGASGSGSGTVTYSVAPNTGKLGRTGTITVAGKTHTVSQASVPCTYGIEPANRIFDYPGGTGQITVHSPIGCDWSATAQDAWIGITSGTGSGEGAVTYSVAQNPDYGPRAGIVTVAGQNHLVTQNGGPCSYSLNPSARFFYAASLSPMESSFQVNTGIGCPWTAKSNNPWITLTSGQSGTGSGTVTFRIQDNLTNNDRTGTITAGGKTLTVTQSHEPYQNQAYVRLERKFFDRNGGPGHFIVLAEDDAAWTATTGDPWIHITVGSSDVGFGVVVYEVDAYLSKFPRTGGVTINTPGGTNNPVHMVYQTNVTCTATLSPTGKTFYREGGSGSFALSTSGSCEWEAESNVGWITIQSGASGVGNGTVTYRVDDSTSKLDRGGTITAAGQSFNVTQLAASCSYGVSPASRSFDHNGGSASLSVTAADTCEWEAASNAGWITVTSGAPGTGNGTVQYSVAANPVVNVSRSGAVSVGGKTHTITQSGVPCSYAILPSSAGFTHVGGTGSIGVTADGACNWSATSNAGWIIVTSGASGSGSGAVGYSVSSNTSAGSRSGTITAAGKIHTVTQSGVPCTYGLSPVSASYGAPGGSGAFGVTSPSGCGWTAVSQAGWIAVLIGSGSGNGTVNYSVSPNTTANPRTGLVTAGGQTFTVNQAGVACSYSIGPQLLEFGPSGGLGTINVNAPGGCGWIGSAGSAWIEVTSASGSGTGILTYSVTANAAALERNGGVFVAGHMHTVTQAGVPCTLNLSPQGESFTHWGGAGTLDVSAPVGCQWTAMSQADWIIVTSGNSSSGDGSVDYEVEPNLTAQEAVGTIIVGDKVFTVTQSAGPVPDLDGDRDADGGDLADFAQSYRNGAPEADMNLDLVVDLQDLEWFAGSFGGAD